jgi:hypothetical protein
MLLHIRHRLFASRGKMQEQEKLEKMQNRPETLGLGRCAAHPPLQVSDEVGYSRPSRLLGHLPLMWSPKALKRRLNGKP